MATRESKKRALEQGDFQYAVRLMKAIRKRVRKEINTLRPDYEYVTVDSINDGDNTARVYYEDDSANVFTVRAGTNLPITPGQKVRIGGKAGDKHILGIPNGYTSQCAPGFIQWTASPIPPPGWLIADGSQYDPMQYDDLFLAIGSTFGGTDDAPLLPNLIAAFTRGASVPGGTGGASTHTHATPNHTHILASGGGVPNTGSTYSAATASGGAGTTGGASSLPPYLNLIPLIKF